MARLCSVNQRVWRWRVLVGLANNGENGFLLVPFQNLAIISLPPRLSATRFGAFYLLPAAYICR